MTLIADIFPELPAPKNGSEDPSTDNMANWSKHCWNLNDNAFTMFIKHCQSNDVGKILF